MLRNTATNRRRHSAVTARSWCGPVYAPVGARGAAGAPGRRASDLRYAWIRGRAPRASVSNSKKPPVLRAALGRARNSLIYSFGFLYLAARSLHDVVPTLGGGVVLAADRVAVDVGGRAHG